MLPRCVRLTTAGRSRLIILYKEFLVFSAGDRHVAVYAGSSGQNLADGELLILETSLDGKRFSPKIYVHLGRGPLSISNAVGTVMTVMHNGMSPQSFSIPSGPIPRHAHHRQLAPSWVPTVPQRSQT